ncbi:MAG: hypothetical protein K5907_10115 [Treponema sp.]|nr:hypothetical protein [Treponema sp.]
MKKKIILINLFIFTISCLYAKRTPPPEVPSIIHNGYEYIANYSDGFFKGKGQLIIKSVTDSEIKKTISIYTIRYNPFLEKDLQRIFIKKTELIDNNTIRIYNENDEIFDLQLINYKMKKQKTKRKPLEQS